MFKRKGLVFLLLALIVSILLIGCGGSNEEEAADEGNEEAASEGSEEAASDGEEILIKFAHEEGPGDAMDLYVNQFKEVIEEKTDGRISVDVYTAGTLGGNEDLFTQLQTGAVEMAINSPGFTGAVIPETQVVNIPFLFSDNLEVNQKVLNESEALYGTLSPKYEEKGVKAFKYWMTGNMFWTANKPLQEPADFKGLKMRGMPTDIIMQTYKQFGADPQGTDSGEIYTMLQTGGIDGQENPAFYINSMKFHEVQDYLINSKHHIYITVTVANNDWFSSLSEEDQAIITETVDEVTDWSYTMIVDLEEESLNEIQQADIEILDLPQEQREAFRELSLPIRDIYAETGGDDAQEIIDALVQEIEEAEAELN